MEGPVCKNFDAVPAMTLWNDAVKSRRPNQTGKHIYKKRNKKKRPMTLMDESKSDIDESKSETDESQIDIDFKSENYWFLFVSLYSVMFIFSLFATLCSALLYYIKSSTYNFIFSKKRQWTQGCI